ncbi:MAG: prenyltransferase [Deltaproteobacteria bacterium]|jgi:1,4-dihydroxy-2-naphthoate octaprenyltransferase|nr:prenyltransferase [Deltaproteobacteria bacterium]
MKAELRNWGEILRTQNLSHGRAIDPVSRWLLIARASLFPLTITSGAIGGLLAVGNPNSRWGCFAIALAALILAQAASNMINDFLDLESGIDSDEYRRVQSAPHPILSGLISKAGLILAIALAELLALGSIFYLTEAQGWPVAAFALFGIFVGVGYGAPPIQLKHRGLGEPAVALVWGPLMVGGTYVATTGGLEPWILVASLPYSLLVTAVLIAKHIDKIEFDSERGIRTLPVRMGVDRALFLNQQLMVLFFVFVICLVLVGKVGVWALLVLVAAPQLWRALKVHSRPRPEFAPLDFSHWPLWYAVPTFSLARIAGALFVLALVLDAIFPLPLG